MTKSPIISHPHDCQVREQYAGAVSEAVQKNDGVVQSDARQELTYSDQSKEGSGGGKEEEMPALQVGSVSQTQSMLRT